MKKAIFAALAASALVSCSYTDPVEYNDQLVDKIDSLTGYQSAFIDDLGKGGDTMKVAYDKMNAYIDTSITKINKMPEATSGEDFKKEVVEVFGSLKNANTNEGKRLMDIYTKIAADEVLTDQEIADMEKLAGDYDTKWEQGSKKFETAQKTFADKAGIKLQEVAKPLH